MGPGRVLFCAAMAAALVLAACESPAGQVNVMQSATTAVVPGSTYAWSPTSTEHVPNGDPRIDNDIIRDRIKLSVDRSLQSKGYRLVDNVGDAQLIVAYYLGLQSGTDYRVSGYGGGGGCGYHGCYGGYGWGMYGAPVDMDVRAVNYTEGTLILDLRERESGKLAWRATSQKRLDGDGSQEKIDAAMVEITKSLPGLAPPSS